jgi:predicted Zn-dependent protease
VVKTVRRAGPGDDGAPLCRLGLSFQPMPPGERRALRILTRRTLGLSLADTGAEAIDPVVAPALAGSARGRELLYQAAFEKLEQKQFERARTLADWAHRGEPKNPFYRSLLHRIRAEESLFCGDHDDAARELKLALDLSPDDDELLLLRSRIDTSTDPSDRPPRTGRTYLNKLLR